MKLMNLSCTVDFGTADVSLPEYGTIYGDSCAEGFVAVPERPIPFSINVQSHDYLAPGLAIYVYIDGQYQCNRLRLGLQLPGPGVDPRLTRTGHRFRQAEGARGGGMFTARPWTFMKLDTVSADSAPQVNPGFIKNVGIIEVLVYRCRTPDDEVARPQQRVLASRSARPSEASKRASSTKAPSGELLGGIFDGASDSREARPDDDVQEATRRILERAKDNPALFSQNPNTPTRNRRNSFELFMEDFSIDSTIDGRSSRAIPGATGGDDFPGGFAQTISDARSPAKKAGRLFDTGNTQNVIDQSGRAAGPGAESEDNAQDENLTYFMSPANKSEVTMQPRGHVETGKRQTAEDPARYRTPARVSEAGLRRMDAEMQALKLEREAYAQQLELKRQAGSRTYQRERTVSSLPGLEQDIYPAGLTREGRKEMDEILKGLRKEQTQTGSKAEGALKTQERSRASQGFGTDKVRKDLSNLDQLIGNMNHLTPSQAAAIRNNIVKQFYPDQFEEWLQEENQRLYQQMESKNAGYDAARQDWQEVGMGRITGVAGQSQRQSLGGQMQYPSGPETPRKNETERVSYKGFTFPRVNSPAAHRSEKQPSVARGWDTGPEQGTNNLDQPNVAADDAWKPDNGPNKQGGSNAWGNDGWNVNNNDGWDKLSKQQQDNRNWDSQSKQQQGNNSGWGSQSKQQKDNNSKLGWDSGSKKAESSAGKERNRGGHPNTPTRQVQAHWVNWESPTDDKEKDQKRRTPRDPYKYAAETAPAIPSNQKLDASHGVQAGRGAPYTHKTQHVEYIDPYDKPYAVFRFKYRSKESLEKILGFKIGKDLKDAELAAEKEYLSALTKEELRDELAAVNYQRNKITRSTSHEQARSEHGTRSHDWAQNQAGSGSKGKEKANPPSDRKVPSNRGGWDDSGSKKSNRGGGGWDDSGSKKSMSTAGDHFGRGDAGVRTTGGGNDGGGGDGGQNNFW